MKAGLAVFLCCIQLMIPLIYGWGNSGNKDRVLLEKISAITLEQGKMTNARRTSPIPQMKCVGGTAGCHAFQPKVVQCINRGSDGYDVQWECKTDMDSAYRFGRIQVSCEGYDYPDDPYVLRGSCGLEYELDLTTEGYQQRHGGGGGHDQYYHDRPPPYYERQSGGWGIGKLITLVVLGTCIYWIVKCCCFGVGSGRRTHGYTAPPQSSSSAYPSGTGVPPSSTGGAGGGGFWTGAATGGLLGYLFGRGNTGYGGYGTRYGPSWGGGYSYGHRSTGWGGGSSWSGSGWGGGSGWSSGGSRRSTGSSSRTTSGFGGTSRR